MTQTAQATYDDANLVMRLYYLRREEKLREARTWFVANFKPKSMADIDQLCPLGSDNNARMRQVASYWDMAASFVTAGVLNPELFFASNREMLVVALRFRPVMAELRAAFKDPSFLKNLETVGQQYSDHLAKAGPDALEAFVAPAWEAEDHSVLREPDFFEDRELSLIYVAKKLKEALALEQLLTDAGLDYLVEPDRYSGGIIFRSERVGAFFYVAPEHEAAARETMRGGGYRPYETPA